VLLNVGFWVVRFLGIDLPLVYGTMPLNKQAKDRAIRPATGATNEPTWLYLEASLCRPDEQK
jgi:hypothetical protein